MRVVALSAIVRNHKVNGIQILTQIRHVSNPDYDPLYNNTIEICGETMKAFDMLLGIAVHVDKNSSFISGGENRKAIKTFLRVIDSCTGWINAGICHFYTSIFKLFIVSFAKRHLNCSSVKGR